MENPLNLMSAAIQITHWSGRGTDVSVHGPENAWPLSGARGLGFIALTIQVSCKVNADSAAL